MNRVPQRKNMKPLKLLLGATLAVLALQPALLAADAATEPAPKPEWIVADGKTAASLPKTVVPADDKAAYKVRIERDAKDAKLQALIEKAESLYPLPEKVKDNKRGLIRGRDKDELLWWCDEFDGIRIPFAITANAVVYYQNALQEFGKGDFSRSHGIKMLTASLDYSATAKDYDEWEYTDETTRKKEKFTKVSIVLLVLRWRQYCGSLCAMGFSKHRFVVFDPNGNVLAIRSDGQAPVVVS